MKVYPKYKSSGVEWIGEIPDNWELYKLKNLLQVRLKYGANEAAELDDVDLPRYIRITDFGDDGKLKDTTFKSLPFEIAKDYFLKEGDILFARSGATVGKTMLFEKYSGNACFAGYLIMARCNPPKVLYKFLYCYTKSQSYDSWKNMIFIENTIQNIGADKYNLLLVPVPSLAEQQQIVDFLDYKMGQCDRFIANRQKQIELLNEQKAAIINKAVTKGINPNAKMKPSGIEWLPEVPETWEVWKMKFLSRIETGNKNTEDAEEDGEYPFYVRSDKVEKISSYSFEGEAILTAGDGVGVAKVYHYANGKMAIHQRVYKISNFNKRISGEFLYYYIKDNFEKEVIKLSAKTTVDSLRMPMLANFLVAHPSQQEQQKILDYIKAEILKIETLISKYQKQIDLMQEYRTTLISQAVTGKIDVRDWQLPHN
jgi:type I restriction enzyme S subunit